MLNSNSNPNPLWLNKEGNLANRLKRNSQDIIKRLFGTKLLKHFSSKDLIISDGSNKCPLSGKMNCFHGVGSSVMDYAISDTHVLNRIRKFELLNRYEPGSDYKPLSLSLNIVMHTTHMEETHGSKRNIRFNTSNVDIFLRDLEMDLGSLTYNNNIDQLYYNCTTTLSTTITNLSN